MMNVIGWQRRYAAFPLSGLIAAAGDTFTPDLQEHAYRPIGRRDAPGVDVRHTAAYARRPAGP
jgi:hypothetical protein